MEASMQTLTVEVNDDFMGDFMGFLDDFKDNIKMKKDKNLELDPYFYERREKLQKIREDIASGKMPTHDFETSMDELINELEA
jgi:hypothetical protein